MTFLDTHHGGAIDRSGPSKTRRNPKGLVCGALMAACLFAPTLATPALGQEASRVNPAGGPGLSQGNAKTAPNPGGVSVFWMDSRDLHDSIRMKRIDLDGRCEGEEISIMAAGYEEELDLRAVTPIDDERTIISWKRKKTAEEQAADGDSGSTLYLNAIFDSYSGRQLTRATRGMADFMVDEEGTIWSCEDLAAGLLTQYDEFLQRTGLAMDVGSIRQSPESIERFTIPRKGEFIGTSFIRVLDEVSAPDWRSVRQVHVFCTETRRGYRYELTERGEHHQDDEGNNISIAAMNEGEFQILCNDPWGADYRSSLHHFSDGGATYHGAMELKLPEGLDSRAESGLWASEDRSTVCYMVDSRIHSISIDAYGTIPGSEWEFELRDDDSTVSYQTAPFAELGASGQLIVATSVYRNLQSDVVALAFDPADGDSMQKIEMHDDVQETNSSKMLAASNPSGHAIVCWQQQSHTTDASSGLQHYIQRYDADGRPMGDADRFSDFRVIEPRISIGQDGSNALYWKDSDQIKIWHCMAGENRGRLISVDLEGTNDEIARDSIRIAMGEEGAFALVADSMPGNHSDRIVVRRFDADGNSLDEALIVMGWVESQHTAWRLKSAWMREGRTHLVANGASLIDGHLVPRDYLFTIDSNGLTSGSGIDITGSTDEAIIAVHNGAGGRFLVIRGSGMSIHEQDGTPIRSEIGLPEGYAGASIDAAARADGGWSLASRERTWEVSADGSIESDSLMAYPLVVEEGTRDGFACTRVGEAKAVFTCEPFTLTSGFDVVRFDFPDQQCGYGDLNCDGAIDVQDLTHLLAGWGTEAGDLDGNGITDGLDLAELLALWPE